MEPMTLKINNVEYVRADSVTQRAPTRDGMQYAIVRTQSAGVFAGYIAQREGQEVTMVDARRLWYWDGAASLSQLAQSGTSKPDKCKFPEPVASVVLLQAIEILGASDAAKKSIDSVKVWKA